MPPAVLVRAEPAVQAEDAHLDVTRDGQDAASLGDQVQRADVVFDRHPTSVVHAGCGG
jgi:hypothetical protein